MSRTDIVGNKWVLAGAIIYLLEWVAIVPAGNSGPADPGSSNSAVLKLYQDHPKTVLFLATWCSLVLVGRVLMISGIRSAVRSTGADTPLLDTAVVAMGITVALELVTVGAVAAGQALAVRGGQDSTIVALDTVAGLTNACLMAPLGVSVGLAAWAMLRTRAFPTWISVVGLAGATLLVVGGVMSGPGYLDAGAARSIGGLANLGVPLFWIWMLATGIFLARRPSASDAVSRPVAPAGEFA
jgi:hypothetical protein